MLKNKIEKIHILIATYIVMIIIELFFCVPYHNIQILRSSQNVPHTEITGNGYSTIFDIADSVAYIYAHENMSLGKKVNTPQIFINISITTAIFVAIYFLFIHKKKKPVGIPTGNVMGKQLSLFEDIEICEPEAEELIDCREELTEEAKQQIIEEIKGTEFITVHTLSPKNGYYKDVIERTEKNSALIDKWLDKSTGCLYMTVMYQDGDAESMLVTKEFFDTLYKHFDI